MIDIDFRCVMREKEVQPTGGTIAGLVTLVAKVPVLQWRKLVETGRKGKFGVPQHVWTEWQDVRTEEE